MSVSADERLGRVDSWLTPRRIVWALGGFAGVIAILLAVRLTQSVALKRSVTNKGAIPSVTVTEAGVSAQPSTVSIIGTIDARYDTPIGVEGDGGRVSAILVEAGDHVRRGQLLARIDTAVLEPQVANLEASLELARAESELAAAEYRRAQAVGAAGALSAEETEKRRSSSLTGAAKVKVAAAQLAEARAKLARAQIRAPADGTLLTRTVEVGQTVAPGATLFRLAEGNEVELRGEVAEQDLPLLKVGQEVNVRLTGTSKIYPGHVRLLGAVIDPQSRLGGVRVSLPADPNLRPGAFARAEVTVSNAERVVLPQTAVLTDDNGSYVLVVDSDDKVERRPVKVSGMVASGVTIADGIDRKDRVVATAGAFLQVGETVRPVAQAAGTGAGTGAGSGAAAAESAGSS
jgi:RND family efflux transporter MFP subunit